MSPALFFSSPRPEVADLPHLITAMDAELIGRVAHLTKSKPGLWRLVAPYDENDVFDPWREEAPFRLWELQANQSELLALGRFAAEALFGTKAILLDTAIDEAAVFALTDVPGQRRDNGGFYVEGVHELPILPQLLNLTRWALMPVAPDRGYGLFVTTPDQAPWVETLREWCERRGRSHWRVTMEDGQLALVEVNAPAEARERAAASQIDLFLGTMDRYCRLADESLLPRIQQRLEAARRMQHDVEQARADAQRASAAFEPRMDTNEH
jgi:hypothetical protein